MTERRRRGPDAARLLGPHADWGNVQLSLEHDYGGGRFLQADSFPLTPELFAQLDAEQGRPHQARRVSRPERRAAACGDCGGVREGVRVRRSGDREPGVRAGERTSDDSGEAGEAIGRRLKLVSVVPELAGESAATSSSRAG